MKPDDKTSCLEEDSLNEPQRLTRNFILGVASSMPFMAGGLIGCLLASEGQLMFSFIWFILAPVPFSIVFPVIVYAIAKKAKTNPLYSLGLAVLGIFVVAVYLLFMSWITYNGTLRMI
jgi:ABC-type anion transport system duplicated permease subunit